MSDLTGWLLFLLSVIFLPLVLVGSIRKMKARLQNRIGAPILQPLYDLKRLLSKGETVSQVTSWIFRAAAAVNFGVMILIALLTPWLSFKPDFLGSDLFLIVYLFALTRLFTVLSALDAGSAFGGFGASREVTLAFLVEPAIVLSLASLGSTAHTSDMAQIFSFSNHALQAQPILWIGAGCALFLASLVELSRMPVDDPTTHLELTMVHEAMILENSGRNLALVEYAHFLKMAVLLGLSAQSLLHGMPSMWSAGALTRGATDLAILFSLGALIAIVESVTVKLRWTKMPEFIAYAVGLSLLCMLLTIGEG